MNDLRDAISKRIEHVIAINYYTDSGVFLFPISAIANQATDQILALIPKPTVRVKCDECGGSGRQKCEHPCDNSMDCGQGYCSCPSCTDGWNDHEIVWEKRCEHDCKQLGVLSEREIDCKHSHGCDWGELNKTLTLPDLIDPDVAFAYCEIHENARLNHWADEEIPNNKGNLRIGEAIKG